MQLTTDAFLTNDGPITPEIVSTILQTFPDMRFDAPIYSDLIAAGRTAPTGNREYEWRTGGLAARTTKIDNALDNYTAATQSLVVDDASIIPLNSIIVAEATREIMYVQAVDTATNTIIVVRGVGADVAAAIASVADNADLTVVGISAIEGGPALPAALMSLSKAANFVQYFRKTVEQTGRVVGAVKDVENTLEYDRKIKFEEIVRDIERSLKFGTKGSPQDADGKVATTTGGLYNAIVSNVFNVGGAITIPLLEDTYLPQIFQIGGARKVGYFGMTALSAMQALYRDRIRTSTNDATGGTKIDFIDTPHGRLELRTDRSLKGAFAGDAIIVNPSEEVRLRHFQRPAINDRPALNGLLQLVEDIGNKDTDAQKDEWVADVGLQWGREDAHALITGITGAA